MAQAHCYYTDPRAAVMREPACPYKLVAGRNETQTVGARSKGKGRNRVKCKASRKPDDLPSFSEKILEEFSHQYVHA